MATKEFHRTDRIALQLRSEISEMILRDLKDPRIGMATITEVKVTSDLAHATVYASTLAQSIGTDPHLQDTIDALNSASGQMRKMLGKRLKLRTIPKFRFVFDAALERAFVISDLISEVSNEERARGPVDHPDED